MDRREFTKIMGAVVAGMVAGAKVLAEEKKADAKEKHACKGMNSCKGNGGCKTGDAGCAGKNSCKGKGGCATVESRTAARARTSCKGQGGCKTGDGGCAGKNSCKGKGGCDVPVKKSSRPRPCRRGPRRAVAPVLPHPLSTPSSTMANRWGFPDLGIGVGLRTVHFGHILGQHPRVDWFEVLSENFMDTGGRPLHVLDQVAERYPVALHGVSLSIGSTDPLNLEYLRKLKALADAHPGPLGLRPPLLDRASLGRNTHDLLPMPYTEEALRHTVARVQAGLRHPGAAARPREPVLATSSSRPPRCRSGSSWPASPRRRTAACSST